MATNKETMKVIAKGIDKKEEPEAVVSGKVIVMELPEEDCEPTAAQEQARDYAAVLACRAADHLMILKEKNNLSTESMIVIVECLLAADAEFLITILETIFLSCGMDQAASELGLMDICRTYDEDVAYSFEEVFWDTDAMDWYSIESLIRNKTREMNNKLN